MRGIEKRKNKFTQSVELVSSKGSKFEDFIVKRPKSKFFELRLKQTIVPSKQIDLEKLVYIQIKRNSSDAISFCTCSNLISVQRFNHPLQTFLFMHSDVYQALKLDEGFEIFFSYIALTSTEAVFNHKWR